MVSLSDFDVWLLFKINRDWSNTFFDAFFPAITDLHKHKLFLFVALPAILYFLLKEKTRKQQVLAILAITLSIGLTDLFCGQVLKNLVDRERPPNQSSEVIVRVPQYGNRSFPSNHAANIFCMAMVLSYFLPQGRIYFYVLAGLVSYSRVYVGMHFPSDVLAGAAIGLFFGWTFVRLHRYLSE